MIQLQNRVATMAYRVGFGLCVFSARQLAAQRSRWILKSAGCPFSVRPRPCRPPARQLISCSVTSSQEANIVDVLRSRGLLDNITGSAVDQHGNSLDAFSSEKSAVYCGFDPTADSLHLGNLLAIVALAWCQRCGHTPVAIIGGATGRVGDPSGKSVERPVLDDETIKRNMAGIAENIRTVLKRSADEVKAMTGVDLPEPVVLDNYDWWGKMSFLDALREVGKHVRVGSMIAKESVKKRLESDEGISFTEFTYQLLQAYDFLYLSDNHNVRIQIGGSDQWGNITAGVELARKLRQGRTLHAITFPLLTTADGRKFGKSESGAVWLTGSKLSPYEFYQHLFKVTDADVTKFLRRLTFLPIEEIETLEKSMLEPDYKPNVAQRRLAEEVTRLVHGEDGVKIALAATAVVNPGGTAALSADALEAVSKDMPNVNLTRDAVVGRGIVDVMVRSGLQKTRSEARRLIKGGGGYLNNSKIPDENATLTENDLVDSRLLLLAAGKKKKLLVHVKN